MKLYFEDNQQTPNWVVLLVSLSWKYLSSQTYKFCNIAESEIDKNSYQKQGQKSSFSQRVQNHFKWLYFSVKTSGSNGSNLGLKNSRQFGEANIKNLHLTLKTISWNHCLRKSLNENWKTELLIFWGMTWPTWTNQNDCKYGSLLAILIGQAYNQ